MVPNASRQSTLGQETEPNNWTSPHRSDHPPPPYCPRSTADESSWAASRDLEIRCVQKSDPKQAFGETRRSNVSSRGVGQESQTPSAASAKASPTTDSSSFSRRATSDSSPRRSLPWRDVLRGTSAALHRRSVWRHVRSIDLVPSRQRARMAQLRLKTVEPVYGSPCPQVCWNARASPPVTQSEPLTGSSSLSGRRRLPSPTKSTIGHDLGSAFGMG